MDEELFGISLIMEQCNQKLEKNDGCDHSLTLGNSGKTKVDVEIVLDWIVNEGGGCDYEVLYNVEERFEE